MSGNKKTTASCETLRTACQQYQSHVETDIGEKLKVKLSPNGGGLSGVKVEDPAVQQRLRDIRDQACILAKDIAFIIQDVIKEPTAVFYEKNTELCHAIRKYKAAIALLSHVDDIREFRRAYLVHFQDLTKDKSSFDQKLINVIAKELGHHAINQGFFSRAAGDFKNSDVLVVTNKKNPSSSN